VDGRDSPTGNTQSTTHCVGLYVKCMLLLFDFKQNLKRADKFSWNSQISNVIKIRSDVTEFHVYSYRNRRTDEAILVGAPQGARYPIGLCLNMRRQCIVSYWIFHCDDGFLLWNSFQEPVKLRINSGWPQFDSKVCYGIVYPHHRTGAHRFRLFWPSLRVRTLPEEGSQAAAMLVCL
jgi:hypothetical protein